MERSTWIFLAAMLTPALVCAQTDTIRRADGSQVSVSKSGNGFERTVRIPSANGGMVPNETVEERVLSKDASGSVIERYITRYDQNGNPGEREKVRIEEKTSAGGSTITTTTYRSNVNGRLDLAERSVAEARKSGESVSTVTSIERPTLNGSLEAVERRESSADKSGDTTRETSTVYRRDANGHFSPALRQTAERTETADGKVSENVAQYEPGPSGNMSLTRQTVSSAVKAGDGSLQKEVSVYETVAPGRAGDGFSPKPVLREQQLIESKPVPGGGVVESVGVRRPSAQDPGKVSGSFQKISESTCKGECK